MAEFKDFVCKIVSVPKREVEQKIAEGRRDRAAKRKGTRAEHGPLGVTFTEPAGTEIASRDRHGTPPSEEAPRPRSQSSFWVFAASAFSVACPAHLSPAPPKLHVVQRSAFRRTEPSQRDGVQVGAAAIRLAEQPFPEILNASHSSHAARPRFPSPQPVG